MRCANVRRLRRRHDAAPRGEPKDEDDGEHGADGDDANEDTDEDNAASPARLARSTSEVKVLALGAFVALGMLGLSARACCGERSDTYRDGRRVSHSAPPSTHARRQTVRARWPGRAWQ